MRIILYLFMFCSILHGVTSNVVIAQEEAVQVVAETTQEGTKEQQQEESPSQVEPSKPAVKEDDAVQAVIETTQEVTEEQQEELPSQVEPAKPAPIEEKELPPLEEPLGIDTVELEDGQGNWLFKRVWWERAEERYEKIRKQVEKIWESRMNFFIKRSELDKKVLDPFYITVGMGQGELQVILNELMNRMEQEQQEEGILSDQERTLLATVKTEQEALRQIKSDVESISDLDHAIDDALVKLMESINKVREQEREAWNQFKEIARVLSEKKARELFYKMDIAWRNIKGISKYLEKEFTEHFSKLLDRANEHVERVKKAVQALKEKGIDFKKQADRLEAEEEVQQRIQLMDDEEEEEEEVVVQRGWIYSITAGLKTTWDTIISIIRWPYDYFFAPQTSEIKEAEKSASE